jgi:uncharacterized protein (DUF1697 family)
MSTSIESINTINTLNTKENLILLDWDDTILPTSWLLQNKITIENVIYSKLIEDLSIHQNCCYEFFTQLLKCSNIIIITNAEQGWVEESCKKILPRVWPIISNIKIVSARTSYMAIADCPFTWKELAFRVQIEVYVKNNPNIVKNIMSIGDAVYERNALMLVSKDLKNMASNYYIKSIKFHDNPDIYLLIQQLDIVSTNIIEILKKNSDLDLMLIQKSEDDIDPIHIYDPNEKKI